MKIIEGMKKLRLLEKKIAKNQELIRKYSAQTSNERLYYGDKSAQEKAIKELIQSVKDMKDEYVRIKISLEKTNLTTRVDYAGGNYSIAELLVYKRKAARMMVDTYESLDDRDVRVMIARNPSSSGEKTTIERFYTEEFKNENLRSWSDFYEGIDSRLEVVNATTELVE